MHNKVAFNINVLKNTYFLRQTLKRARNWTGSDIDCLHILKCFSSYYLTTCQISHLYHEVQFFLPKPLYYRHTSCAYYASEHTMLPKNNKLKYPNQTMQTIIAMEQKLETLVRFKETRWQHFISAIEEIIFENRNYLGK